jgi:hypothetical protein
VQQGYVSVTPLRLDLTDHEELARARRRAPLDEASLAPGDRRREREPSRAASERETAASEASTG